MVTVDDVRAVVADLPRSEEVVVRDRIKLRVGRLVYVAFSADETVMGCGFPKEERAAVVAARPEVFSLPRPSDLRFNWIEVRLSALGPDEMRELVLDAWAMCVPKRVAAEVLGAPASGERDAAVGPTLPPMSADDLQEELQSLERQGWDALCDSTGDEFYGRLMTDDAVMVLANGAVMDRDAVVAALGQAPPWASFEIEDPRVVRTGPDGAALVYRATAHRDGDEAPFVGLMSSVYVRRDGGWRLALYQQTPVPSEGG